MESLLIDIPEDLGEISTVRLSVEDWIKTIKSIRKPLGLSKKEFNNLTISELFEYIKAAK